MRRLLPALICLALLVAPVSPSHAAGWHRWTGTATDVFRTGQYSRGEFVYTNGVRQARGANTDALERSDYYAAVKSSPVDPTRISRDLYNAFTYDFFGAHRAAHNGDYLLPNSSPNGTGEIAELRLAIEGPDLYVRFLWNAMPAPDAQIATLTFGEGSTTAWPHGARQQGSYARALTVWGTGGALTSGTSNTPISTRVGNHTTEARVPLSLLPAGPWNLRGGSGLTAPANRTQYADVPTGMSTATLPGSGGGPAPTNVWDLLFAGDTPWSFDELHQSRQLTTALTTASQLVDPALLTHGASVSAPLRHGDFSRLLHSALPSQDGIRKDRSGALGTPSLTPPITVPDFDVSYFYNAALQDYAMHVPTSYDGSTARPLVVYLHGYTGLPEEPFRNPTGLVQAIDAKGWLLAAPLGRGDWSYRGGTPGAADVLEVLADVEKRYRVDRNRIYLMGHSMGGYGTNNLAAHYPDLFAAVAPAEGTEAGDLSSNLRNTPWFEMTAEEDLDTNGKAAKALYAKLSADGDDATLLDYSLKTHEYSSIYDTLPRLLAFFSKHVRSIDPAVVSWTRPVGQDNPALHQLYDGAWWLHDVQPASGVQRPTVTVETMALPHAALGEGTTTDRRVDEGGPSGRTAAELFQTVPPVGATVVDPDTLRITSAGAISASVRLTDAHLLRRPRLVLVAKTDRAFALRLIGDTRTWNRTVDGRPGGVVYATGGDLTVLLPAGNHTVLLTPAAALPRSSASSGSLPATGGSPVLELLALALLGAWALTRRAAR